MNRKQGQLLADIANYIRTIKKCDKTQGIGTSPQFPGCLMCNAERGGLIDKEEANSCAIAYSFGFSTYFSVTETEALDVLYHARLSGGKHETTGENYYIACKELLGKYGYSHLLDEHHSTRNFIKNSCKNQPTGAEIVKQFLTEDKEPVTV